MPLDIICPPIKKAISPASDPTRPTKEVVNFLDLNYLSRSLLAQGADLAG